MKIHNCIVNVSRDPKTDHVLMTAPKEGITENELTLLRGLHGAKNVVAIKDVSEIDREQRTDLLMLARAYGDANELEPITGPAIIKKFFQVDLHEFGDWLTQTLDSEEEDRERKWKEREIAMRAMGQTQGAPVAVPVEKAPAALAAAEAALAKSKPVVAKAPVQAADLE
jgi:FAD/FMN-containing dehydrogenase